MTQRQRLILAILFLIAVLATIVWLVTPVYAACHKYSIWKYSYPQPRCVLLAQQNLPLPPKSPCVEFPEMCFLKDIGPDIPLPPLEDMEFPPDCISDACQRLKGIGLLRELRGTN